jgi:hypothetical protein
MPTRKARERKKSENHSTKERSSTELRFASFQLNCEVTCGAVKGQDERRCQGPRGTPPFGGALGSPASHHRTSMLTSENKLRGPQRRP